MRFLIIKPKHTGRLKKHIWVEKNRSGSLVTCGKTPVAPSRCKENSAWPFKRAAFDYLNTLSLYTTFSLFKHTLTAHT